MATSTFTENWLEYIRSIPAIVLSAEFFIGGFPRASSWPFRSLHNRIYEKSIKTSPEMYPIIPFRNVRSHMIYVGVWMMGTGVLLAVPNTRGSLVTLGLVYFWTGAGVWSQARTGMPYWLPICNAILGTVVYMIEGRR